MAEEVAARAVFPPRPPPLVPHPSPHGIFYQESGDIMMLSVILPTYNEAENIKLIVPDIFRVLGKSNISGEILVIDDDSPDGTAAIAAELASRYPVRVHQRKNERGLATAVIKGLELSKGDICIVMDADLSHPTDKIPEMIEPIINGQCDATVGSRYVDGGGCDNWPFIRRVLSKGAGLLARGVTDLSDPTSGFMAIKKEMLSGVNLDPVGWKIVLEIIVKTNSRLMEIPIVFSVRQFGESKLDSRVQKEYLLHLCKLYSFKYPNAFQFLKFCTVGVSGLFVDTIVLVSLVELFSFDPRIAAIFAFSVALTSNYFLNRFWTFYSDKQFDLMNSYILFFLVCLFGLLVRIGIMHLLLTYAGMGEGNWYIIASMLGIMGGTISNFLGSKYIAFSKNRLRLLSH